MMPILLINTASAVQRLAFQQQQMARLGLSFELIQAYSATELSDIDYQHKAMGWQRPLRKVEWACFLSHQDAWQRVIALQQPCLILEDDAVLAQPAADILKYIALQNWQQLDLINLEVRGRKKIVAQHASLDYILPKFFQLYRLYQDRTGAAAYILYPSGAEKLYRKSLQHTAALADAFIFSHYGLTMFQLEPAVALQTDQLHAYGLVDPYQFTSSIGRSEQHVVEYADWWQKIVFKQRRIIAQCVLALRYIQFMSIAQPREIRFDRFIFQIDAPADLSSKSQRESSS